MHAWGYVKNREKRLLIVWVFIVNSFFFARKIYSHRRSRATMASPWATRIATCSSRSPLSRSLEKTFYPAVQGIKNAHLRQANASVCGQKISLDPLSRWHMLAIWGKQDIGTYATERSLTNTRTHRKRAVVSSTKARIILTNGTKKRNPIKPKSANSTHPDESMAQSRREILTYAQGTLFRLVLCSCKIFGLICKVDCDNLFRFQGLCESDNWSLGWPSYRPTHRT
jgi:hypothetical protein